MSNRIVTRYASLLLAAFVFAGCSDDEPTGVDILPFDVSPISFALDMGGTKQVKLTGIAASDVTWESTNPAVATVSATGVVTGVAVGTVAVTAVSKADNTVKASATVQVNAVFGTAIARNTDIALALSGSAVLYRVFVPEGSTSLKVTLVGPNGDGDIFVRFGSPATFSTRNVAGVSCVSWNGGTAETCTFANPAEGSWYILVDPYEAFTGATLRATVTP